MDKIKFYVSVDVQNEHWNGVLPAWQELIEKVKETALDVVAEDISFLQKDKEYLLNVCLSDDENIRALNKEFRGMDKPTNVLSFANIDDEFFEDILSEETSIELGDIMIALETMQRESEETAVSFENHFCHLWLHGFLHILGYDHIDDEDAEEMESLEIKILEKLGISNPYEE